MRTSIILTPCTTDINRTTPALEELVDASVAVGMGYGESKWVCEQLLGRASEAVSAVGTSFRAIAVRLGQITGTSGNGAWNTAEYVPAMLKSSQYLGCVPDLSGVCDHLGRLIANGTHTSIGGVMDPR